MWIISHKLSNFAKLKKNTHEEDISYSGSLATVQLRKPT